MSNKTSKAEKPQSKAKKIVTMIINVTFVALIIFLVVLIGIVIAQKVKGEQTNLFGYSITRILTSSMDGDKEDSFAAGEVILTKVYNGENLEEGDIVTFWAPIVTNLEEGSTITHRIYSKNYEENGSIYYVTKGDARPSTDAEGSNAFFVTPDMIVATYVSRLPVLTWFFSIISEFWGFLLIIVLPLVIILIVQIVKLVKLKQDKTTKEQNEDENNEIKFTEDEIKQFIEENKKEQNLQEDMNEK